MLANQIRKYLHMLPALAVFLSCGREDIQDSFQDQIRLPQLVWSTAHEIKNKSVISGSYIVTFKADNSRPAAQNLFFNSYFAEFKAHQLFLSRLENHTDIEAFRFLTSIDLSAPETKAEDALDFAPPENLKLAWQEKNFAHPVGLITRVDFKSPEAARRLIHQWHQEGRIWFAEPNYTSALSQSSNWNQHKENYQNIIAQADSSYYWLKKIDITGAFTALAAIKSSYNDQPIVAVMDSGVDTQHPSLKGRIWENSNGLGTGACGESDVNGCNTSELKEKGVLGDGDVSPFSAGGMGKSCPKEQGQCKKNCCHGTHVAGIIAADGTRDARIAGVCPTCRIMVLRVVGAAKDNPEGTILDSSIINALKYVTHFRANDSLAVRVINASFGKFQRSRAVSLLVRALKDTPRSDKGAIIIGAAGNEDTSKMQYPAAFKDAIAVANIHRAGPKHISSNFGRWVDVAAPGTEIESSTPGSDYEPKSGTSMAAPVVAGIAGLILAARPTTSVTNLRRDILNGADPKLYDDPVNDAYLVKLEGENSAMPLLGTGMVNAPNSVKQVQTKNRPALASLDRVDEACGVVGITTRRPVIGWIFFLLPLLMLIRLPERGERTEASTI